MVSRISHFLVFITITMGVGFTAAYFSLPDEWYRGLNKAWFNPPNWVFGPAWSFLYILIGIAGGCVYKWDPKSTAMKLWWLQLILNGAWSIVFFTARMPSLALLNIVLLLLVILFFIRKTEIEVRPAMWCFVPYLLWVSFATLLNASIVSLN